jgi:hypothetical protein
MSKKGAIQKVILYTFYLIMVFIILYALSNYLTNYFNGAEFNKEFIVNDLGLAIDTISFSPFDIKMKYNYSDILIIENKDNILNAKIKELEVSKKYKLISKINDFSLNSNEINVKKDGDVKIS